MYVNWLALTTVMRAYLFALVKVVIPETRKTSPVAYPCPVQLTVHVVPAPTKFEPAVVVDPAFEGAAEVPVIETVLPVEKARVLFVPSI